MKPPEYRKQLRTGIVHFGPGAFHRAHQADYIDRLLHDDPRWGIAAVSLRSAGTIEALKAQEGLYTLAILDAETSFRTIAPHNGFFGPGDTTAVRRQLRDPNVGIVTSTVTEKGYCLAGDGSLDFDHPDVVHDLANPQQPVSIVGWLALGLGERRADGVGLFTPICCDNMSSNGRKLRQAVIDFARRLDVDLADWIAGEVRFPNTVVDSITPATDERLRRLVRDASGFDDAVPVSREAYTQWVIEDILPSGSSDLASAGVTMAADVDAWALAKLRILNGSHSTLAYIGLLLGHDSIAEAMGDPLLSAFVERMVSEEIIPTLQPSPIDLHRYTDETFARFRNPAIHHRLSQIAWDGSQKLPYRLLDTIMDARAAGRPIAHLAVPIAAWILFLERQARAGEPIVDPLADTLSAIARTGDAVDQLLKLRQVFPERLAADPTFRDAVTAAASTMQTAGVAAAIES